MSTNLGQVSVLIVDDNKHMLSIVKTILRGFGPMRFYESLDPTDAFEIVRNEPIDLIIVDYLMDILDGIDFVRLVRTADDSPNPFIPIIMLTAYSERSKVVQARDAGVTEFCCKPVTAKELYSKVVAVVNHPRPFVRTGQYFGPDRRRLKSDVYRGPHRRNDDEENNKDAAAAAE